MLDKQKWQAFGGYWPLFKSSTKFLPNDLAVPDKPVLGSNCLGRSPLAVQAIARNLQASTGERSLLASVSFDLAATPREDRPPSKSPPRVLAMKLYPNTPTNAAQDRM